MLKNLGGVFWVFFFCNNPDDFGKFDFPKLKQFGEIVSVCMTDIRAYIFG